MSQVSFKKSDFILIIFAIIIFSTTVTAIFQGVFLAHEPVIIEKEICNENKDKVIIEDKQNEISNNIETKKTEFNSFLQDIIDNNKDVINIYDGTINSYDLSGKYVSHDLEQKDNRIILTMKFMQRGNLEVDKYVKFNGSDKYQIEYSDIYDILFQYNNLIMGYHIRLLSDIYPDKYEFKPELFNDTTDYLYEEDTKLKNFFFSFYNKETGIIEKHVYVEKFGKSEYILKDDYFSYLEYLDNKYIEINLDGIDSFVNDYNKIYDLVFTNKNPTKSEEIATLYERGELYGYYTPIYEYFKSIIDEGDIKPYKTNRRNIIELFINTYFPNEINQGTENNDIQKKEE